jgi:hypothetical protein
VSRGDKWTLSFAKALQLLRVRTEKNNTTPMFCVDNAQCVLRTAHACGIVPLLMVNRRPEEPAAALRSWMKAQEINQEKLVERLKAADPLLVINRTRVSRFLTLDATPTPHQAAVLEKVTGVPKWSWLPEHVRRQVEGEVS